MIEPRSFGTHSGTFHADEVTACSLLLLYKLIDRHSIFRTRDPERLSQCEYVCDVGGVYDPASKRFDHHQITYQGPLSSAGMVLLYLRDKGVIPEDFYLYLHKTLVAGVDAHDIGAIKGEMGFTSFSQVVSNFMTVDHLASEEEHTTAFFEAVDFVYGHLDRLRIRYGYMLECREKVHEVMQKNRDYLFFEEPLPWLDNFFDLGGEGHPALFVIMPSGSHWKLRGIPPSLQERMKVRLPLPERWAGLQDVELAHASGIDEAIFCHKGRFISIWKTKEGALRALDETLALAQRGRG